MWKLYIIKLNFSFTHFHLENCAQKKIPLQSDNLIINYLLLKATESDYGKHHNVVWNEQTTLMLYV